MTDGDRSLERAARSWLEIGPAQAPARAVEAALLRIETTPQERDLRILRRFTQMSMPARLATAAVIGVLAVGGALYVFGRPHQNVAAPGPSPSASPTASPSSSSALVSAPAPDGTWGTWQATLDTPLAGPPRVSGGIQLSIDWPDSTGAWIQTESGDHILLSDSLAAPAGEIDLVASDGSVGCQKGDVGRYSWSRSSDGLFLTLTAIEDACAARAEAYSRTWVHSHSGSTDGGLGVMPFEGWLRMTLPSQRFGLSGNAGYGYLHEMDGPDRTFFAIKDPMGLDAPCAATRKVVPIGSSRAAVVAYLRGLSPYTVSTVDGTVGGAPATHVTLTRKVSGTCLDGSIPVFASRFETDPDREWMLTAGGSHSIWIVERPDGVYAFIYEGAAVTPDDETSVISSMEFLDKLPTP